MLRGRPERQYRRQGRHSVSYQILLLYLSHGLRETAYPGVAALHAFCRLYNTLSLRFLTMCTLVPHAHSTMKPPRSKLRGITRKGIVCETPRFLTLFPL